MRLAVEYAWPQYIKQTAAGKRAQRRVNPRPLTRCAT